LVFRPKYNVSVFRHPWVRQVSEGAFKEVAEKHGITLHEMKVMPDHIHMFVGLPTQLSISKAFQLIKGGSTRIFFKKCTRWKAFSSYDGQKKPHLWSTGKFYRSVGNVKLNIIEYYIAHSNKWDLNYLNRYQSTLEAY
jgi:putative transposase